jgi:putative nucleotidyltransferase with HDIG domain
MRGYRKLRWDILHQLSVGLHPNLTYHGIHHTVDVLEVCNGYIRRLKLKGNDASLLRIGALAHDIGFMHTYKNHEEKGVEIISKLMESYDFSNEEIDVVSGLIMATKVPQNPRNLLEEILCDADLDYLGRLDFDPISESLYEEFMLNKIVSNRNEWNQVQIRFLENHHYHTAFANKYRKPKKEKQLLKLRRLHQKM